jgi:hypothetical protein
MSTSHGQSTSNLSSQPLKVGETTILVPNSVDISTFIVECVDMIFHLKMEPTINNVINNFGESTMVQMVKYDQKGEYQYIVF